MADIMVALRNRVLEYQGVRSLIGQRMYPDVFPQNATLPCVAYRRISTNPAHILLPDITRHFATRIEINCIATTRAGADELAKAITYCGICQFQGPVDGIYFDSIQIDSGYDHQSDAPTDGSQEHRYATTFDFQVNFADEEI